MTKDFASDALRGVLERRAHPIAQAGLFVLATAVFYGFAHAARYAMIDEFSGYRMDELIRMTAMMFTALYALLLAVQMRVGRKLELSTQVVVAIITGFILLGKISLLDYVSDDYTIFLSDWIYSYQDMSIRQGLGTYIASDYSPPYLYLLLLISRVHSYPWQYMVKAISMAFEVLMAYGIMQLAGMKVKGTAAKLMIFNMALMLPSVVLNGAYWGQCDVIYTSLCLLALYLSLQKRGVLGMLCFGVALSFKLQTVFFLPVLLPLWLRKDIKLRHLLMIPVGYMGMMLPALLCGKSLHHVLTVYMTQAGAYNFMSINGPSLYNVLSADIDADMLYGMFSGMALALAFAFVAGMCALMCARSKRISRESTLLFCLLMLGGIPFFLPKMHERYTFGADVLALAAACHNPRRMALPFLFGFASYICYTGGLPGDVILPLKWATVFQGAAVALTLASLLSSLCQKNERAALSEVKE